MTGRRRGGDEARRAALIALYDAEREAMVRLAHLLTGSPAIAEDLRTAPTLFDPPLTG